ncbi:MAG: Jag N-terminal domain-containing protein [Actinomycetota bacterium]|nr:Jag N-terminal domain-containing protein [Actinomycetota bacterium]
MEWVETTGRTIDDAKEAALDELGVDEQDAEFEVMEEPRLGLFGRLRSEGRVRARVRPVAPRSKDERRRRGRSPKASGAPKGAEAAGDDTETDTDVPAAQPGDDPRPTAARRRSRTATKSTASPDANGSAEVDRASPDDAEPAEAALASRPKRNPARNTDRGSTRGEGNEVDVSLDEQSRVAEEFLRGLVQEFGVSADIVSTQPDEDTLDLALSGDDLGMLIGPKGATLLAIQDLTRTVVQRRTGAGNGRIHVDVSGYRKKRSEALTRFALQVAEEVRRSGVRKALDPMSAPDRKVVHDALTEVEGVSTVSEGEDAGRRVVILPQAD